MTDTSERVQVTLTIPADGLADQPVRAKWLAIHEWLASLTLEALAEVARDGVQITLCCGELVFDLELDDCCLNNERRPEYGKRARRIQRIQDRPRAQLHIDWHDVRVPRYAGSRITREDGEYEWVQSVMLRSASDDLQAQFALRMLGGDHVAVGGNLEGDVEYGPQLLVAVLPDADGNPAVIVTCVFARAADEFAPGARRLRKVLAAWLRREIWVLLLEAEHPGEYLTARIDTSEGGAAGARRALALLAD